jgi:hypothetical protein
MRVMTVLALVMAAGGCATAPTAFRATPIEVVRVEGPARTEQEKLADYWRERRAETARRQVESAQAVFIKPFVEPSNPTQWPESEDQQRRDAERPSEPSAAVRAGLLTPAKR